MINRLTKFGAYLILIAGILVAFLLFCFAIYFGFIYTGSNQSGRIIVSTTIIAVSIALCIITFAIFETILETVKIEHQLDSKSKVKSEKLKVNDRTAND